MKYVVLRVLSVTVEIIAHVISHRCQRGGKHPFCCSFVRMGGGKRGNILKYSCTQRGQGLRILTNSFYILCE